jgi:predicted ferric reductase
LGQGWLDVTATVGPVRARRESPPRASARVRAADHAWIVGVIVVANAVVVAGLWLRHGGLANASGPGGLATAAGQLTGLIGTYAVLLQLMLMARIPWLERCVGFDRLAVWHRWNGFASVSLLVAHTVLITMGYAASNRESLLGQTRDFVSHYPDVLLAFVGLALLVGVAATSVQIARRRLSRESWYLVHVYAYLAIALGFAHQLAVGSDFDADPAARAWWVALYVVTIGSIVVWRIGQPLRFNARHGLRVANVEREAPGVVSIYLTGRALNQIDAEAGQFFLWRFLTREGWWQAHPFSLSAKPTARKLRITVKDLGDFSKQLQQIRLGTRVFAEGPYGTFTAERQTRRRVLMIAGGIGITPLRALLETLRAKTPGEIMLLYRVIRSDDVIFADELKQLSSARGVTIRVLTGEEIGDDQTDRLGVPMIARLVPDVAERDVFVCGPPGLIDAVRRRLRLLDVPPRHIHFERFAY